MRLEANNTIIVIAQDTYVDMWMLDVKSDAYSVRYH